MKTAELIALAVQDALKSSPRTIGALLSPIGLSSEDVVAALRLTRKRLGGGHYLVGSAPDAPDISEERFFVASDERAAERATDWRNQVRPASGERLVYLSVEEHGKASGLKDCLVALSEDQIADTFLAWCDLAESAMPVGLADALRLGRVVEGVQIEDLCAFAGAIARDPVRARRPWDAVGKHLPRLALARDSGLGHDDTAERLANNARLVRALATGESRRKAGAGALAEVELRLVARLDAGEDLREALTTVDLGEVKTEAIAPKGAKLGPRKPAKGKPAKPTKGAKGGRGHTGEATPKKRSEPAEERATGTRAPAADTRSRDGGATNVTPDPHPERGAAPNSAARSLRVSAPSLSPGVEVLLSALVSGDGRSIELKVRSDARQVLTTPPKHPELRPGDLGFEEAELREPLVAWRAARSRFLEVARGLLAQGVSLSAVFVGAMPRLLTEVECRVAFDAFNQATCALYRAALDRSERAMRGVLALDTVAVSDADGTSVRIIGPLHLLWFGQVAERARIEGEAAKLPEGVRRALLRTSAAGPTSPAEFPEVVGGELSLSRPEDGLIVFERVPEVVERASLEALGQLLVRRHLALSPQASLGCRIAFEGPGAASFLDGVARYLSEEDEQAIVEVLCERPPVLRERSPALSLLGAGRLRLGALPLQHDDLTRTRPHIVVRAPTGRPRPGEEEPSGTAAQMLAPAIAPSRTRFELRERSLRVVTSVAGVETLEAFEALHAAARGRQARAAFVLDAAGLALRGEADVNRGASATWHVVIAPRLGNRSPMGAYLLAHERVDDRAVCAVLSKEVRVAMRSVRDGLARAGFNEEKPTALKPIAMKLAQTCGGGLLSLRKDNVELLASALLSLELSRRTEGHGVIVPLSGRSYEALTGASSEDLGAQVAFSVNDGVLRVSVGFASFDANLDLDLSLPQVGGRIGERLHAIVSTLQMLRGDDLGAQAARDTVGWMIWPALAGMEAKERPVELIVALSDWSRVKEVRIEAHVMVPTQFQMPKGKTPKIARWPLTVTSIDVPLIKRLLLSV